MYSYVIRMSLVCTRMSSVYHSYVLVCHPCVTRMYSCVIRMSLVCTHVIRMSLVCIRMPSVCHSYVIRMYSYVIRMLLVCTRMSSVCHSYVIRMSLVCARMSSVCHSYEIYHEPFICFLNLFISLIEFKKSLKEHRCNFKIDKITK